MDLPQLIRKSIKAGEDMPATKYDHTIYEIEGDISELGNIQDHELNLEENKIQIICKFTEEKCSLCHLEIERNEKIVVTRGYKFHAECANYYSHINCKCCNDCSNAIVIN